MKREKIEIAKKLKNIDMDVNKICEITGLTKEEIDKYVMLVKSIYYKNNTNITIM